MHEDDWIPPALDVPLSFSEKSPPTIKPSCGFVADLERLCSLGDCEELLGNPDGQSALISFCVLLLHMLVLLIPQLPTTLYRPL